MTESPLIADPAGLSRMKWEYERERTGFDDLLAFGTADMDYRSPEPVLRALRRVIDRGHLGYPMVTDRFYDVIHDHLLRQTGWDIDARTSVGQNVGIYVSAKLIMDILTKPGDKITIMTPVHFCFRSMISQNGRTALECPLLYDGHGYKVNFTALESCLESGSRVLWFCNPHNPVGRAWNREELERIADICAAHDAYIMSDDVYSGLLFDNVRYIPIASVSRDASLRTITMYSTSKVYNTTGLRHSYIVTENPELLKRYTEELGKMNLSYGLNIMGMEAVIAAYTECDEWLSALMREIESHHRFMSGYFLSELPGAAIVPAESMYFAWADMRRLRIPPQQLAYLISEEEHMIVENGAELGKGGAGFIRLNLATSLENIEEGARRLKAFWLRHL